MRVESDFNIAGELQGLGATNVGTFLVFSGDEFLILTPGAAGTVFTSGGTNALPTYAVGGGASIGTYNKDISVHEGAGANSLEQVTTTLSPLGTEIRWHDAAGYAWVYEAIAATNNIEYFGVNLPASPSTTWLSATVQAPVVEVDERIEMSLQSAGDVLPSPFVVGQVYFVQYYVDQSGTGAGPFEYRFSATKGGAAITATDDGTLAGDVNIKRLNPPKRVWPADFANGGTLQANNKLWQRRRDPYEYYWYSAVVLDGATLTVGNFYVMRPPHADHIVGWGVSTQGPEVPPGSGDTIAAVYDLKTTPQNTETPGAVVTPRSISIGINGYHAEDYFIKQAEVIQRVAGEGVWLNVSVAGDAEPDYVEVHLLMRKVPSIKV